MNNIKDILCVQIVLKYTETLWDAIHKYIIATMVYIALHQTSKALSYSDYTNNILTKSPRSLIQ